MRIVKVKITAYCRCEICCGEFADGVTSTGRDAENTVGVAIATTMFRYGDKFYIPGIGLMLADDTGGAMIESAENGKKHIDIRMTSHQEALEYGVKNKHVLVLKKG